jgi:hypothetical protein
MAKIGAAPHQYSSKLRGANEWKKACSTLLLSGKPIVARSCVKLKSVRRGGKSRLGLAHAVPGDGMFVWSQFGGKGMKLVEECLEGERGVCGRQPLTLAITCLQE